MKKIPLCGKRGAGLFALVDDEDFDKLSGLRWHYSSGRTPYPRCSLWVDSKIKNVTMHILLIGKKAGHIVDHINGDPLDNRRSNLRFCTHAENSRNRRAGKNNKSGFKGVYRQLGYKLDSGGWKQKPAWVASININGKQTIIGRFSTLEDAARARIAKEIEIYGEFSRPETV